MKRLSLSLLLFLSFSTYAGVPTLDNLREDTLYKDVTVQTVTNFNRSSTRRLDTTGAMRKSKKNYIVRSQLAFILNTTPDTIRKKISSTLTQRNMALIYGGSILSRIAHGFYRLKVKGLLTVELDVSGKTVLEDTRDSVIIESKKLDGTKLKYIGSIVHRQRNFSKVFEYGILVTNFYEININGEKKVAVSGYTVSEAKRFWGATGSWKLKSEVTDNIDRVYKTIVGMFK